MLCKEHKFIYFAVLFVLMAKIMMIYAIPKGDSSVRISFNRKLFNYRIQSHKGKYKNKTKGVLKEFERPTKSCIVFDEEYLFSVNSVCEQFKIRRIFYNVTLRKR